MQPGPGPVHNFIGAQTQLNCSVVSGYEVKWELFLPGEGTTLDTSSPGVGILLAGRGIVIQNTSDESSQLVIDGNVRNNGSIVQCVAVNVSNQDTLSEERVQLLFYGK